MKLLPHQAEPVRWLAERPRAGFFDDQGLGKTISALTAADMIAERVLVVSPTIVVHNWKEEARDWMPGRTVSVLDNHRARIAAGASCVSMTHGMLLRKSIMDEVRAYAPDLVILDESHHLRGATSKKASVFFDELVPCVPTAWCLTGTPMPGWPCDLWRTVHGLWPDEFPEDWHDFRNRYCRLAPSDYNDGWRPVGVMNAAELRARLAGKFLRRRKSEVLDLPPLTHEMVTLSAKLPHEMLDLDGVLDEEHIEALLEADSPEAAFAVLLRGTDLASYRRRCGEAKAPLVAELIAGELEFDCAAKRVLMCHHKAVADVLHERLARFNPIKITGATAPRARTEMVRMFQNNPSVQVAVCQIVAGGTGITLTASDDIVFVEASFVPGENAQARDRIYRIGQERPCRVRFVALDGTVDKIIMRVLRRKTAAIQEVLQ